MMACATCDSTMQRVNEGVSPKVFWCPRCGTIKFEGVIPEVVEPKLVHRALTLCDAALDSLAYFTAHSEDTAECEALERAENSVRECVVTDEEFTR